MSLSEILQSDELLEKKAIESFLFEKRDDFVEDPIPKKKRGPRIKVDYWDTNWGRWLRNPLIHDPNSNIAKLLMLRFRFLLSCLMKKS